MKPKKFYPGKFKIYTKTEYAKQETIRVELITRDSECFWARKALDSWKLLRWKFFGHAFRPDVITALKKLTNMELHLRIIHVIIIMQTQRL